MAFSDQSRIMTATKAKNYSEILFREDSRVLDAELNILQTSVTNKLKELVRHGLKYDSGFVFL